MIAIRTGPRKRFGGYINPALAASLRSSGMFGVIFGFGRQDARASSSKKLLEAAEKHVVNGRRFQDRYLRP
jgi:hypothetical protein